MRSVKLIFSSLAVFSAVTVGFVSSAYADTQSANANVYESQYYEEYEPDGAIVYVYQPFNFSVDVGATYTQPTGLIIAGEMDDGGQANDCGASYDGGTVSTVPVQWSNGTNTYSYSTTVPENVIAAYCGSNPGQDPFSYAEWQGSADFEGSWTVNGGAFWNDGNGGAYPGFATATTSFSAP